MNNGKCLTTGVGSQCICQKGTSGVLCERSKLLLNMMKNPLNNVFLFEVERSSNAKYCPLDCQAGGTCVFVNSAVKCRCPPGRTGHLCEIRMFYIFIRDFLFILIYFRFW